MQREFCTSESHCGLGTRFQSLEDNWGWVAWRCWERSSWQGWCQKGEIKTQYEFNSRTKSEPRQVVWQEKLHVAGTSSSLRIKFRTFNFQTLEFPSVHTITQPHSQEKELMSSFASWYWKSPLKVHWDWGRLKYWYKNMVARAHSWFDLCTWTSATESFCAGRIFSSY